MNPELLYAYAADITKSVRDEDGNLIVDGIATDTGNDLDGDRCDPAWLKQAMPKWFEWGNIREMHQPVAAGVGLDMTEEGDAWSVRSKCVDEAVAKKLEAGVYKGDSIGINNGRRRTIDGQNWIVSGDIVEVSYVDRPCNPTAKLAIAKMAGADLRPVDDEGAFADTADLAKEADTAPVEEEKPFEPIKDAQPEPVTELAQVVAEASVELAEELEKALTAEFTERDRMKALAYISKAAKAVAGEQSDIDGAAEAIAVISRLIISEANGLADGDLGEINDIQCLIEAACSLKWFMCREQGEEDGSRDAGTLLYAATGDMNKLAEVIEKRTFSAEERRQAANTGAAMPGGRYPIENAGDVTDAVEALNRTPKGVDKDSVKAHIMARAKAIGAEKQLPPDWSMSSGKAAESDGVVHTVTDTEIIEKVVQAAVTKATEASEERVKVLEADLAKVLATPIPGGPVLLAPGAGVAPEKSLNLRKAAEMRAHARTLPPAMAKDYEALADQLEKQSAS